MIFGINPSSVYVYAIDRRYKGILQTNRPTQKGVKEMT